MLNTFYLNLKIYFDLKNCFCFPKAQTVEHDASNTNAGMFMSQHKK